MGKILIVFFCLLRGIKLKKKSLFLLSLLVVFSIVLFACNSIQLTGGPSSRDTVYGNGGSAVVKGNYLYFANAFIDYNSLGINDNTYEENSPYTIYGIYRTRLNSWGGVDVNEETGIPSNVELLTYNIGGFAYSGLYIFGDYLYYATPYSTVNSSNETTYGHVRFERVRLDGTEHSILYSASDYTNEASYSIACVDNVVYISILNADGDLTVVSVSGGNTRVNNFSSDVTSYAIVEQRDVVYNSNMSDINKYIYYTKQNSDTQLYYMYRKALNNNSAEEIVYGPVSSELLLVNVKNDKVYFTKGAKISSLSLVGNEFIEKTYTEIAVSESDAGTIVDYVILDGSHGSNMDRGILAVYYDGTNYTFVVYNGNNVQQEIPILDSNTNEITLYAAQGNEFYYQIAEDDALYKCELSFSISGGIDGVSDHSEPVIIATTFTADVNDITMFDYDEERIFVYNTISDGSLNYLTMFMTNENVSYIGEEGAIVGQFIGKARE